MKTKLDSNIFFNALDDIKCFRAPYILSVAQFVWVLAVAPAWYPMATALAPRLKKAEEKAGVKKDESPDSKDGTPPPAQKKLCTLYAKQLSKMPEGDQTLVKDTKFIIKPIKILAFFFLQR